MSLTAAQRRALNIFRDKGALMPKEFAEFMWPDSEGWHHHTKCGPNGVHQGGGMYIAAGGYIGKLRARGWVKSVWRSDRRFWINDYCITTEGRLALREDRDANQASK